MATKKTEAPAGKVAVTLPRARVGEDPNFQVSINGVNYLIPKGKTSYVDPSVAEEIERAEKATDRMYDKAAEMRA